MRGRFLSPGTHGFLALRIADRVETATAQVTAEAIDQFAALSGDRFAVHMDDAAAQALGFPGRIAHGLQVLSLIDGLKNQAPAQFDAIASLGWEVSFRAPVMAGDCLTANFSVQSKKLTRDGQRGIVTLSVEALNQRAEIVLLGRTLLMMRP